MKKSQRIAVPLPAPTHDGIWIPVQGGKPGEPVKIKKIRVEHGVTHFEAWCFGWDIPDEHRNAPGVQWLEYVPSRINK